MTNIEMKLKSREQLSMEIITLQQKLMLKDKEIERLKKENNDLRRLYQRTYKHLFEIGNDELARYFQAQIDECPTFYVEPIIEDKKIEKLETYKEIDDVEHYANILKVSKNGEYEIDEALSTVVDKINEIIDKLNEMSDKE